MNVKDRLSIKMENDMRKGVVQFDSWVMPAKVKKYYLPIYIYIVALTFFSID